MRVMQSHVRKNLTSLEYTKATMAHSSNVDDSTLFHWGRAKRHTFVSRLGI